MAFRWVVVSLQNRMHNSIIIYTEHHTAALVVIKEAFVQVDFCNLQQKQKKFGGRERERRSKGVLT